MESHVLCEVRSKSFHIIPPLRGEFHLSAYSTTAITNLCELHSCFILRVTQRKLCTLLRYIIKNLNNSEVRHPRCVGTITKNICVLHIQ